jgi:hypothetical protein
MLKVTYEFYLQGTIDNEDEAEVDNRLETIMPNFIEYRMIKLEEVEGDRMPD